MAELVAPHVDKIRYNPATYTVKSKTIPQKVQWLVDVARDHDIACSLGGTVWLGSARFF